MEHLDYQPKTFSTTANPTVVRVLSAFARLASRVAVIVPLLVLLGWVTDQPALKRIVPTLVAMNPMTAVSFLLCGMALWIIMMTPTHRLGGGTGGVAIMLSLTAVIVGVIKLVSFFLVKHGTWD